LKIILFDLDGTLIDSTKAIVHSFEASFKTFEQEIPQKSEILRLIGHPLEVMFESLGAPKSKVWDYVGAYRENYKDVAKPNTTLLPTAYEAVLLASKHAKVGAVTTKSSYFSEIILKHLKVFDYFDTIVGREDVKNPKPDPEPIIKALKDLNGDKDSCWMIGDTGMDMEAASRAGVNMVAVSCGFAPLKELEKYTKNIEKTPLEAVEKIVKI